MNTIYRVVWNASTNSWVVASEMAKGRKKKASGAVPAAVMGVLGTATLMASGTAGAVT